MIVRNSEEIHPNKFMKLYFVDIPLVQSNIVVSPKT